MNLLKFHSTSSYLYQSRQIQCVLWKVQLTPVAATLKRRIAGTLHEEVPTCISGCILVRWTQSPIDQESLHICQLHNNNITTLDCTLARYFHVFQTSENHLNVIRYTEIYDATWDNLQLSPSFSDEARLLTCNSNKRRWVLPPASTNTVSWTLSEATLVPRFDNKERVKTNKDLDHFSARTKAFFGGLWGI